MRLIDLTGQRFGELVVVERGETRKCATYWTCRCNCGRTLDVGAGALRQGGRTSCGHVDPSLVAGRRPWPSDVRYLVAPDGTIVGPSGQVLTPTLNGQGYPVMDPGRGPRPGVIGVHIVVCETFHGPRPAGLQVCHRDGDASNPAASNLRWGTPAENSADRITHGTQSRGEQHGRARLTDDAVRVIRAAPVEESDRTLARRFGVSRRAVMFARTGETWKHVR